MKKGLLFLVLIMAVVMSGIVAYVSVNGLLKIFSGAGFVGLLFFSVIEVAKIVATSTIHTYGKVIGRMYNTMLTLAIIISMVITSIGIYGFLSASYQESFTNMTQTENKVKLIESKNAILSESKEQINTDIKLKRGRISKLTEIRGQQEVRLDSLYAKGWGTSARKTEKIIKEANEDIKIIDNDIKLLNTKVNVINDSINSNSIKVIELNQNNSGGEELNTLKYLANVTNSSMDEVMKWFILCLIIIGDPMAVLMVVVFNKIINRKKEENPKEEKVKVKEVKKTEVENEGWLKVMRDKINATEKLFKWRASFKPKVKEVVKRSEKNVADSLPNNNVEYYVNTPTLELGEKVSPISKPNEPVAKPTPKVVVKEEIKVDDTIKDSVKKIVEKVVEVETSKPEESTEKDLVKKHKKIDIEDIKEIKERNRGFSVKIPDASKNSITRL